MRTLHPPTSAEPGDGRVVYLFGEATADVPALTGAGYTVVVDTEPTRRNLREAFYSQDPELEGRETAGVAWVGDGARDGSLRLASGKWVSPSAIESGFVTHELDWAAFGRCCGAEHEALWRARLGMGVNVVAVAGGDLPIAELARDPTAVTASAQEWGAGVDPGDPVEDAEEDGWWVELFGLLDPQRGRLVEEQLGLSTRQFVWRLGELFATAAIQQLQGKGADAAEGQATAAGAAQAVTSNVPELFTGAGDVAAAITWLGRTLPRSAVGRGVRRFGPDHAALFESSLQLLLLSLSAEASDPIRERLRELGPVTQVSSDLWDMVLASTSKELFAHGHKVVFDALSSERQPQHATRALAFGLGRRLAIAASMDLDDDPEAADMLAGCQDMVDILKVEMPHIERQARFKSVAEALGKKHGPDHKSLFDLATQLIALRGRYDPMSPETTYRLMKRLTRARKKASMPSKLFKLLRRVKESTANRSKGYDLIDQTLQAISEHLMLEID